MRLHLTVSLTLTVVLVIVLTGIPVFPNAQAFTCNRTDIDYVIITSGLLRETLVKLALLETARGFNVCITTVEEIGLSANNTDIQSTIRSYIIDMKRTHDIRYVLLAGNPDLVPTAYFYAEDGEDGTTMKATDDYYVFLEKPWDMDHDNLFLESLDLDRDGYPETLNETLLDVTPDVYVGRLPMTDKEIIEKYVSRLTTYYTDPPRGNWWDKIVFAASILNYNDKNRDVERTDSAVLPEYIGKYLNKTLIKLYEADGIRASQYPYTYPLTRKALKDVIAKGAGFVSIIGHGNIYSITRLVWTHDDGDEIPEPEELNEPVIIDKTMVKALAKEVLVPPVFFLDACSVGRFDDKESLGEMLLEEIAIAVVAPTRVVYYQTNWTPGEPMSLELERLFWLALLRNNKSIGEALYNAKEAYIKSLRKLNYYSEKTMLSYVLLGDPTVKPWTSTPKNLSYSCKFVSDNTILLSIGHDTGKNDKPNALLTIFTSKGDILYRGVINSSVIVSLSQRDVRITNNVYIGIAAEGYKLLYKHLQCETAYHVFTGIGPGTSYSIDPLSKIRFYAM